MKGVILDCSIAISWCFTDETTPATIEVQRRVQAESAVVPAHWYLEVANVLAMAELRKRITASDSQVFLETLRGLDFEVDGEGSARAFSHLLPLSRTHRLTVYDAAYLDLALRRNLPLATLDDDLRKAAKVRGVALLGK